MSNVIGFNNDPDRRQTLWNCLVSLREVIAVDEKNPEQVDAYIKEKHLYQVYLDKYLN